MYDEAVPVLIVGGGSVGLSAAFFLSRLGVPALLIERRPTTSLHPRARGINYRTLELFRTAGLEEAIQVAGAALANSRFSLVVNTLAGQEIRRLGGLEEDAESRARLAQLTPTTFTLCAQDELEPLLMETAKANGAEIRFGTELISFEQDAAGVTAQVLERETGTQRTIRATYLLATDGVNSPIRRQLGINTTGRGSLGHYMGIYFRADLSELVRGREFVMCFLQNPEVPGTLSSVNNKDRWVLNVEYEPANGATPADFTPARCIELVGKAVGAADLAVELLSVLPWEAAVQVADSYQVGQIFLAGDAVHGMPPAGAFGMNTGIQDVHNLAWKLAAVLNAGADPALLATYAAERRPVGKVTAEQAGLRLDFRGGRKGGRPTDGAAKPALMDDLTLILGCRYNSKAVVGGLSALDNPFPDTLELSGQPGTRAPHVWLEQNGQRISTLDLFDKHLVLLTGADGAAWSEAARKVASQRKIDLETYRIGSAGELQAIAGNWPTAYGVTDTGAVLVRPDGFVAWRSAKLTEFPEKTLEAVLIQLLG